MRSAPISTAALLAFFVLAAPAMAFDVQNGGGQGGGTANLAPEASSVPGVSLDQDLRAQLGLADDRATAASQVRAAVRLLRLVGAALQEPDDDGL